MTHPSGDTGTEERTTVALSALEHAAYCPRQAALIHVDQVWTDSGDTVRGDLAHTAVDLPGSRQRSGTRLVRSLPVWSDRLGLYGVCDLVEITGTTAVPVEYKVGAYKPGGPADVQLAGQALCLRDMGLHVAHGYVYSVAQRRRHQVTIDAALEARALEMVELVRHLVDTALPPTAVNDRRCRRCSLREDCLPELTVQPTIPRRARLFDPAGWEDG